MPEQDYRARVAAAEARTARGERERAAGADDRARAILAEVERRGRGGQQEVAGELGVSVAAVSEAFRRARGLTGPQHGLPGDALERLLAAELPDVPPLARTQWETIAWIVRGTVIDPAWIGQPGQLLAYELEDAELDRAFAPDEIIAAARAWTRVQALAVIDACQRDDISALPAKDDSPES
jgi:hypothetical protein